MDQQQLNEIIRKHQLWLENKDEGERANLRNANLRNANLHYANLCGANLWGADLQNANLRDTDLRDTDLRRANLWGADLRAGNLRDANLRNANLHYANLWGANLRDASLQDVNGNLREIKSVFLETWPIIYTSEYLQIGCERHPIADWWGFTDERIAGMDSEALEWWRKWKDTIRTLIEMSPAVPTR